ncbi:MAG TPA: HAMP domain-containing sensor histidine kinase [Vicinamibacterales bacterium]|nr:HAMP domain-containing sensor histidine kinase [Vicinamibacterales bacterium]
MNPQTQAISSENVVALRLSLGRQQDLVSLRRETRAAAEQCGLDARSVRSLSAASYEAAHLLFRETEAADAEISVTPSGELQISIRTGAVPPDDHPSVSRSISALASALHRVAVHDADQWLLVTLTASLPCPGSRTLSLVRSPVETQPDSSPAVPELVEENVKLRRALIELQDELTETNRGVIALYAERERLEDSLRTRAEELAAANRAKEDFLATLSHELRTPLNAMLGWTRLLRMGKLDEPAKSRALETIERNAHVQAQLIADILDVSRIVTGRLRLDLRPIELAPVVDAALDTLQPSAAAKGVDLSCTLARTGKVLGDPDRLQQVVWNLLSNAIKFTPAGGRVSVALTRSGAAALIAVTDTGEGIPPSLLPYVFDRFTQGDSSVTRMHGGLGLGLSIVRHIVELHGGHVSAQSEGEGCGATFSVKLPLRTIPLIGDDESNDRRTQHAEEGQVQP